MKVANSVEYAIHGLSYVAVAGAGGRTVLLRDTARAIRVPESYLRKAFQALARKGIVASRRGAKGGYSLGRKAAEISVRDVVEAFEGPLVAYSCFKEQRGCNRAENCLVRDTFRNAAGLMAEALGRVSLQDIVLDAVSHGSCRAWLGAAPITGKEGRMDHQFCPGAKLLRQPKPEFMKCTYCGEEIEIWSDEIKAVCDKCGRTLMRDGNMSCLEWCAYGRECVGEEIYSSYVNRKAVSLKKKLLSTIETLFGVEDAKTRHAREVLQVAEELLQEEKGDPNIVIPSSILHDVGPADGLSAREHQRKILLAQGFRVADIEQICQIIDCLKSAQALDSVNFRVVHDADCLPGIGARGRDAGTIESTLLTASARNIATAVTSGRSRDASG